MSPAKEEQMMTRMVRQRGHGEFAREIGCDPRKLAGARKKCRGGKSPAYLLMQYGSIWVLSDGTTLSKESPHAPTRA